MIDDRVLLSSLKAFALNGVDVQELGAVHVLYLPKRIYKFNDVVPVNRAEVADVQAFEDVLLVVEQRLNGVVEAQYLLSSVFAEQSQSYKLLRKAVTHFVVDVGSVELVQVLFHAAYTAVYAHIVVVEDDEQVVRCAADIV